MRLLVTGSAGFVGQEMVPLLQERGHRVTGVDIVEEGLSDEFVQHDLTHPLDLGDSRFDVCIHLASGVGGILYNLNESTLVEANDAINRTVVDTCLRSECGRVVFFSSINVFERSASFAHGPLEVVDQVSPYAVSKARGEATVASGGAKVTVIRPTNIFGRSQSRRHDRYGESHVIPDLLHKIDTQSVLEVFGDGTQIRNFVHVRDICRFVADNLEFAEDRYFNLRSDVTVSIADLARELLAYRHREMELVFLTQYMSLESAPIVPFDMRVPEAYGWASTVRSVTEGLDL